MDNELFEKRILFESLANQKKIMRDLKLTAYDYGYGYDDYDIEELIRQCDGIVNDIKWKEYK